MNPENKNISNKQPFSRLTNQLINHLSNAVFYLAILFFIIGFNFSDRMAGNWYQQFMPDLNGRTISDIFFLDSLTGWAVTPYLNVNDTSYVIKTTNSGNNWFIQHIRTGQFVGSNRIIFLNTNTGYTAGVSNLPVYSAILKTTNGGSNWFNINPPVFPFTARDISILNEDTIWVVSDNPISGGGVYFTSNGGTNWQNQLSIGSNNPDRIYMYNERIGFVGKSTGTSGFHKTTNSGVNWNFLSNSEGFNDMYFVDSLTGWKSPPMKKTINGGLNWVTQVFPTGGNLFPEATTFTNINKDTIWTGGGYKFFPGSGAKSTLNFTSNGGDTWYFQLIDTNYGITNLPFIQFTNKRNGWAYGLKGVHTTNGGDTVFYLPITQISSEIPKEYLLMQNYPNPFNPSTNIKYSVKFATGGQTSNIKLVVYDIQGKLITELVNQSQNAGTYVVDWNASGYSSGIYFYSLIIDGKLTDTKKMILIK